MGLDIERFQEEVNQELICGICTDVLEHPLECLSCQNSFCKECIQLWQQRSNECTNCRNPLSLQRSHKFLRSVLDNLRVSCIYSEAGCQFILRLENLYKHEKEECRFRLVKCSWKECSVLIRASEKEDHEEVCEFKLTCCQECNQEFQIREGHSCVKYLLGLINQLQESFDSNQKQILKLQEVIDPQDVHPETVCRDCGMTPISGVRSVCYDCKFSFCLVCKDSHEHKQFVQLPRPGSHENVICDECNQNHISGVRYKCKECGDFDLCENCILETSHEHNDFFQWAPYTVRISKPIDEKIAYYPGQVLKATWKVENLGFEPIKNVILTRVGGSEILESQSIHFEGSEILPKQSSDFKIQQKLFNLEKGLYRVVWRLATLDRLSFFGPELIQEVVILEK